MSVIDVDSLLIPISDEAPAGDNLEYDPGFTELERLAEGKPEQQVGDSVIEAEPPDWKGVQKQALELFTRTRDLRIGMHLARALLREKGLLGFSDGLAVLRGMLEQYWPTVHPQLDPDDDNDPTMRINTLATLADVQTTLRWLREAPLVESKMLGRFSLRDLDIAAGNIPVPDGLDTVPEMIAIDGAFMDCDVDALQALADAVAAAVEHAAGIEAAVTTQVGAANTVDMDPLVKELKAAHGVLLDRLARRGVGEGAEAEAAGGEGGGRSISGEVNTREDVIRVLDKACDYFARHEPSSPVPLLLQRAKRLVSKNFMEIIQDLAPGGLAEAQNISGVDTEGQY